MGAIIEVKYFNNFLLKKVNINSPTETPIWNGSFGIPTAIGGYPVNNEANTNSLNNAWAVEEARIRGGFNNTNVDFGVKAYLVEDEPNAVNRFNSLIYSGIFNSRTGINNSNVFSIGEDITKSADPVNGSIQKLYAEDTNLIIFQESKVSRALIDKDAIYSAEGGGSITNINTTIGTIQAYAGEFGISKDPGSFAVYGYRKYFTDKNRNAILRLSKDGLTDISNYGMYDYFRDRFSDIDIGSASGKIVGGWDIHNKQYTLSLQSANNLAYYTLSFDETVLGWTSFYTYKPDQIFSLKNNTYSLAENGVTGDYGLWQHYSNNVNRSSFYGVTNRSFITFIFNPAVSLSKVFQTVNYEGSNGWQIDTFISDSTGADLTQEGAWELHNDTTNSLFPVRPSVWSYVQGSYDNFGKVYPQALTPPIYRAGFDRKENKYFSNLINFSTANDAEVVWGPSVSGIKGYFAVVTVSTDTVTDPGGLKELFAVSANYVQSSY